MTDDPRIAKLPRWAQDMIRNGQTAADSAQYWRERHDEALAQMDQLRTEHAKQNGADVYDTWVSTELNGGDEARYGLGVGRPVDFGPSDDVAPLFTVTYVDGGLNITVGIADYSITPQKYERGYDLRIT